MREDHATDRTYAVIGAGPSGLAVARTFAREGIPFVGFERHDDVGGIWDIDNPGSPMYESAHFISSRTLSAFDGFPMPEHYPDYPDHEQILAYIRSFADHHDLRRHFRFGVAVASIQPVDGGWEVRTDDGGERRFDGVVMASGNFWTPNLPAYPGEWERESYHSSHYRNLDELRGERVLIVGAGNSGCDIACDAARAADRCVLSVRRGYRFVPKHIFGMPADVFRERGPSLPGPLQQLAFDKLIDVMVGDLTRFGMPAPDHRVLTTHPIMNSTIVHHITHGDVEPYPDIAELEGDRVRFVDGAVEEFDLIIWATGFQVAFPYLDRDQLDWRGNDPSLFLNTFHRRRDDLFALGIFEVDAGVYPLVSLQAELIARVILDQEHDPRQAEAFRRLKQTRPDLSGGIAHVDSPRHAYYVQDAAYKRYGRALLAELRAGTLDGEVSVTVADKVRDRVRDLVGRLG